VRILSALMFFPRGGSAHVTRALARELPAHGCEVTIVSGSRSNRSVGDAELFYEGLDVRAVDFARGDAPMHPSYEDRPDAPDRVFAALDDEAYEAHVAAWARVLEDAGAAEADVLHLHHLTPIHEAAARVAPDVPVVGHLHGTELLMLERIADGPPPSWLHADAWERRMRRWAHGCERILVLSRSQVERVRRLLDIDPGRCVVAPNGFDPSRFAPRPIDRHAFWQRQLGAATIADAPVLVSASRFTEVKRIPLLIAAFERARRAVALPASLVVVGGYPGEWEGEHPSDTIQRTGARDVYLAGWHDHDALAEFFAAADAVVLASVREQFGSVLVEGMACGIPAIAVNRLGPADIVRPGQTGWLVAPDDEAELAGALAQAIAHPEERLRRGAAARRDVLARFAWPALAERLCALFAEVAESAAGDETAAAASG
jgi:glycosyltransferase involved in cell wall biosynthesis